MKLFQAFNQVGVAVLIATHDVSLIQRLPRRILHLEHGHLVQDPQGRER